MNNDMSRRGFLRGMATAGVAASAEGAQAGSPAPPKVRWDEMLPDELLAAIERHPVCYMAYGLAEPHGPYCALGLDWLKAQGLCERAAAVHGGVVAPPFAWHVQERPGFDWLGEQGVTQALCSSIPADLWLRVVLHQIRVFDARGFRVAILVTGHYGGPEHDLRLLCEYYTRRTGSPLRLFSAADAELIRVAGYGGDHAGITEASQLLAMHPGLVDLPRKAKGWPTGRWAGVDFPLPDGRIPSVELGRRIVDSQIARLGEIQREQLAVCRPREGWKAPSQTDVDALWTRFEKLTRKYWWCSLTLPENRERQYPHFPGWEALGE